MHMPVSLRPKTPRNLSLSPLQHTPTHPNARTDSLVFSITSEKHIVSPKETILLESKQEAVSKELQSLHQKLHCLESRVSNINSADATPNLHHGGPPCPNIDVEQFQPLPNRRYDQSKQKQEKQNRGQLANTQQAGRIFRKGSSFLKKKHINNKIIDHLNCTTKSHASTNPQHMTLQTEQLQSSQLRQYHLLQKQVVKMRRSMQKSERSKSVASQQLSASKSTIRSLKSHEKKQQGAMNKLKKQLRRSEAIREKQKEVITQQQKQIESLLKQLCQHRKIR